MAERQGRHLPIILCVALIVVAGAATAWAAPLAGCRAERAGGRALVTIDVQDLFDEQLLRLVQLGLVGRLKVEAALYRRRPLWFDAVVAEQTQELGIGWSSRERTLYVDGKRAVSGKAPGSGAERLQLPTLALRPGRFSDGTHYVAVNLRLEVVTAASLGEVARWLVKGGDNEVPRALVDYLAADLARRGACRCDVN